MPTEVFSWIGLAMVLLSLVAWSLRPSGDVALAHGSGYADPETDELSGQGPLTSRPVYVDFAYGYWYLIPDSSEDLFRPISPGRKDSDLRHHRGVS